MTQQFIEIISKYGLAFSMLYPAQIKLIEKAVAKYERTGNIEQLEDSFCNLAYLMIICDLRSQDK